MVPKALCRFADSIKVACATGFVSVFLVFKYINPHLTDVGFGVQKAKKLP